MMKLDKQTAQALTVIIHALRPTWDEQGIFTALAQTRDMGDLAEVTLAAVHAATSPEARTPAVIHTPGPHWHGTTTAEPAAPPRREERCTLPGHDAYPARTCTACRTEWLTTRTWPPGTHHQDAAHAPTDHDDARTRAAGETNG